MNWQDLQIPVENAWKGLYQTPVEDPWKSLYKPEPVNLGIGNSEEPEKKALMDKLNSFLGGTAKKLVGPISSLLGPLEVGADALIRKDSNKNFAQRFKDASISGSDLGGALETRGVSTLPATLLGFAGSLALPGAGELGQLKKADKLFDIVKGDGKVLKGLTEGEVRGWSKFLDGQGIQHEIKTVTNKSNNFTKGEGGLFTGSKSSKQLDIPNLSKPKESGLIKLVHYTDADSPTLVSTNPNRLIPNSISLGVSGKTSAPIFGKNKFEFEIPKDAKTLKITKDNFYNFGKSTDTPINRGKEIYKYAKENGYDVVHINGKIHGLGDEYAVINKSILKQSHYIPKVNVGEQKLISKFGVTTKPEEAGFIGQNGQLIRIGPRKYGQVDHFSMAKESGAKALDGNFVAGYISENNNLRIIPKDQEIIVETVKMPNEKQIESLRKLVTKGKKITADITDMKGNFSKSGVFDNVDDYVKWLQENIKVKSSPLK